MDRTYVIGLDIGTTTVSATVIDAENGAVEKTVTLPNNSFIASGGPWEKIQDVGVIASTALGLIGRLTEEFPNTVSIGVTGQMHGIVYTDRNGEAVSPLYTWQDGRAGIAGANGKTTVTELLERTGYNVPSGYGMATHYVNLSNGCLPSSAAKLCTIHDYIVMKLTGRHEPLIHSSDAASLGLFRLKDNRFDLDALHDAGIGTGIVPECTPEETVAGHYGNIPVCVAIGDNQASFLGSVADLSGGMLVNVGTGSQVSAVSDYREDLVCCELRPFVGRKYLTVGSALCGGRAYATLELFWRGCLEAAGIKADKLYGVMNKTAARSASDCGGLRVDTAFSGTRANPERRGSVHNISVTNFTPENLTRAVLAGMADELYGFAAEMLGASPLRLLVGSGNGLRLNPVLAGIVSERFSCSLSIPVHGEEAAFGASLFSLVGSRISADFTETGRYIAYKQATDATAQQVKS